ncbi:MAG TPA: class I SAM-dependent methyltransferase, partial [Terricaulis sp.]|nr:class I SAM-dependent methyltransferase [Terricaulis sp.]
MSSTFSAEQPAQERTEDRPHGAATPAQIMRLAHVPAGGKALLLALTGVRGGALALSLPNNPPLWFGDEGPLRAAIRVQDVRFFDRVLKRGDIGFAESYIEGEWSTPDLADTLTLLASNAEAIMRYFVGGWLGRALNALRHAGRANTRRGARRNILAHYDLGNRFFEAWLDPSMTYSSARFDLGAQTLEQGQRDKYRAIADRLGLERGQRVLEIGCGWGGFAEIAARDYG